MLLLKVKLGLLNLSLRIFFENHPFLKLQASLKADQEIVGHKTEATDGIFLPRSITDTPPGRGYFVSKSWGCFE